MKKFDIKSIIMAMMLPIMMLLASSCANDEDIKFVGNVDMDFVNSIFSAGKSYTKESVNYTRDIQSYADYKNGMENWTKDKPYKGENWNDYKGGKGFIHNGYIYMNVTLSNSPGEYSVLYAPWGYYNDSKGEGNIRVLRRLNYELNPMDKTIIDPNTNEVKYRIEKAGNGRLTLSSLTVAGRDDEAVIKKKYVEYKIYDTQPENLTNMHFFDSRKEAILYIVRTLRKEYGDRPDRSLFSKDSRGFIYLDWLEEDIVNDSNISPTDPSGIQDVFPGVYYVRNYPDETR